MSYAEQEAATPLLLEELNETKELLAAKEAELQIVKGRLNDLRECFRIEHDKVLCALDTLHKFSNESRPGGFNNAQECIDKIKEIK